MSNEPLISFLMLYRGRPETDTSIYNLFVSIEKYLNLNEIELVIKMDTDDTYGKLIIEDLIKKFPNITVKLFVYNQGEGRWDMNCHFMYLFTRRNPTSQWIGIVSDDSVLCRDPLIDIKELNNTTYIIGNFQRETSIEKMKLIEE